MTSTGDELPEAPTPAVDPAPEPGPGGPADAIQPDIDDFPPTTPDQPRSAQVTDGEVPDEIDSPEETDEGEREVDATEEAPA